MGKHSYQVLVVHETLGEIVAVEDPTAEQYLRAALRCVKQAASARELDTEAIDDLKLAIWKALDAG